MTIRGKLMTIFYSLRIDVYQIWEYPLGFSVLNANSVCCRPGQW